MRNGIVLVGMAFAVTLAICVAKRLSEQALAVTVGALCGILASVPVSIAFVIAASRNWGRPETVVEEQPERGPLRYPPLQPQQPIVVIAPPQQASPYGYSQGQPYYLTPNVPGPGTPRDFRIVGDE